MFNQEIVGFWNNNLCSLTTISRSVIFYMFFKIKKINFELAIQAKLLHLQHIFKRSSFRLQRHLCTVRIGWFSCCVGFKASCFVTVLIYCQFMSSTGFSCIRQLGSCCCGVIIRAIYQRFQAKQYLICFSPMLKK